jgi:hypothetical protein
MTETETPPAQQQTTRVGFCVDDLGGSQLSFFLTQALNEWVRNPRRDAVVFYEDLAQPRSRADFAVMQSIDMAEFSGILIATSYATAIKVLACKGPSARLFYLQDLEWMRRPGSFDGWRAVYSHPDLQLVVRSDDHAEAVRSAWGKKSLIAPTPKELLEALP